MQCSEIAGYFTGRVKALGEQLMHASVQSDPIYRAMRHVRLPNGRLIGSIQSDRRTPRLTWRAFGPSGDEVEMIGTQEEAVAISVALHLGLCSDSFDVQEGLRRLRSALNTRQGGPTIADALAEKGLVYA